jgi:anaerobic nitric oxide reductase transcription regulator
LTRCVVHMTTMKKMNVLTRMASRLAAADGHEERYKILLQTFQEVVGGDAVALLRKEGKALNLVACRGLSPDALDRRFQLNEHPRLDVICQSKDAVVFPSDCSLADPYDGLIGSDGSAAARVHSCMGLPLVVNRRLVGALTADALAADVFESLDLPLIQALSVFAGAEMHTTRLIEALELKTEKMCQVSRHLVKDARGLKGGKLVGTSAVIRRLRQEIELIARSDFSVLITGETGAGKEIVARAVHAASKRREHPLLYLNCATLPQSADRAGKLELADEATLFLDEIGELPLDIQPRLLRFLQAGEVQPVGSNRTRTLNVRLLAATNRVLPDEVQKERFRADLFHRLNVYPIHVPPLREHLEDIPLIAGRFCEVVRRQLGVGAVRFRPDTLSALQSCAWPGNVRELENVITRAVLRASAERPNGELVVVAPHHLGSELASSEYSAEAKNGGTNRLTPAKPLRAAVEDFQRDLIRTAVETSDGNWAAAARALGINRSNLHKLAKRLDIKD